MIRAFLALALFSASISAASAGDFLQGHIEHKNTRPRLVRPAMPSKPTGDALDQLVGPTAEKSSFQLTGSSISGTLDKKTFEFIGKQKGQTVEPEKKNEEDKEELIAWEKWHRHLSETIYRFWSLYSHIPGEGQVTLDISREGDVNYRLREFHVSSEESTMPNQRELFERALNRTLNMIEHSDDITFPRGSQRESISLNCNFKHSAADDLSPGYDWKRDDYERVRARR